ncbi:MAG: hypothetical protein WCP33_03600, partial [Deltaproteobacteria bacterium]
GWLTMVSAFASIPLSYLDFKLEGKVDAVAALIQGVLQIAGTLLFVIITLLLKRFLNRLLMFHHTDKCIELMIMANIVSGVFILGGLALPKIREAAGIAALLMVVFEGVIQLQFGYKLLKLENSLGGLLKPYCYLNMATGVCVASIVLILPGVAVSAISDLMLATIFFNVAKQIKETALNRQ